MSIVEKQYHIKRWTFVDSHPPHPTSCRFHDPIRQMPTRVCHLLNTHRHCIPSPLLLHLSEIQIGNSLSMVRSKHRVYLSQPHPRDHLEQPHPILQHLSGGIERIQSQSHFVNLEATLYLKDLHLDLRDDRV